MGPVGEAAPRAFDLVIGVPSVSRSRDYLTSTVAHLLERQGRCAPFRIGIVVFNADRPPDRHRAARRLVDHHQAAVREGRLRVIESPHLDAGAAVAAEDGAAVRRWQQRQVLDAAYLMDACADLAPYYLHLEDDVEPAIGYGRTLREVITRGAWLVGDSAVSCYSPIPVADGAAVNLQTYRGFIGVLFPSRLVRPLAAELRARSTDLPVDHLVAAIMSQRRWVLRAHVPSLFEHVGFRSSLPARVQSEHAWRWAGDRSAAGALVRRVRRSVAVRWERLRASGRRS